MIVAGVGCRKGASADDIGAVIADALARAGVAPRALNLIAAPELKRDEHGLAAAGRIAVGRGRRRGLGGDRMDAG